MSAILVLCFEKVCRLSLKKTGRATIGGLACVGLTCTSSSGLTDFVLQVALKPSLRALVRHAKLWIDHLFRTCCRRSVHTGTGREPGCMLIAKLGPGEFSASPGACRGSSMNDNHDSYYEVKAVQEAECKELCLKRANCTGVETSSGRCELWTRTIEAFKNLSSFTCWRKNPCALIPRAARWHYNDGWENSNWKGVRFLACGGDYELSCESGSGYWSTPITDERRYPHECSDAAWLFGWSMGSCWIKLTEEVRSEVWGPYDVHYRLSCCHCKVKDAVTTSVPSNTSESFTSSSSTTREALTTSVTTTSESIMTSKSTETSSSGIGRLPNHLFFEPLDGGSARACRGSHPNDNLADYYMVHPVFTLGACKTNCILTPKCTGIEYSAGRCEVWTEPVESSKSLEGFACLTFASTLPEGQICSDWTRVAGNGSVTTAESHKCESYMAGPISTSESITSTKSMTTSESITSSSASPTSQSITTSESIMTSESIETSSSSIGRLPDHLFFEPLDGGSARACSGANPDDDSPDYYVVHAEFGLDACKTKCILTPECTGIEYSAGRCEVWTEPVESSKSLEGFACLTFASTIAEGEVCSHWTRVDGDGTAMSADTYRCEGYRAGRRLFV